MTNPPTDDEHSSPTNAPRTFQSAKSYLERSPRPDRAPSSNQEFHAERQRQLLASWAESEGRLIDPHLWSAPLDHGAEHRVFFDPARGCAVKIDDRIYPIDVVVLKADEALKRALGFAV